MQGNRIYFSKIPTLRFPEIFLNHLQESKQCTREN